MKPVTIIVNSQSKKVGVKNAVKNDRSSEVDAMRASLRDLKAKVERMTPGPSETPAEFKLVQREAIQAISDALFAVDGLR